jgi:hypothetical protein
MTLAGVSGSSNVKPLRKEVMENLMTVTKDDRWPSAPSERVSAPARELAQRLSGGVEVLLLWHPDGDWVEVAIRDSRTGVEFQLDVPPADALDAYYHPYAYAARLDSPLGVDRDEAAIVDG